jgi:FkbM family methyltransferase
MSPVSGIRRRKQHHNKPVVVVEMQSTQTVMPHDENLLERSRTQWQFGDWGSLARLERDTMQHHPDRAKLALLAAAGHFQVGGQELARQYIRLAQDWGCSDKLIMRVLAAGVHNSLGRAAAQAGGFPRALGHFDSAIRLGSPGSDSRLMLRARAHEQFTQLCLKAPDTSTEDREKASRRPASVLFKAVHAGQESPVEIDLFFSEIEGDRSRAVEKVRQSIAGQYSEEQVPPMDWVSVGHRSGIFFLIHFSGDYIPKKMAEKGQFYESPFLNLLARLHQPGKLIVDGGANIGNHSVFFAGVMGAPVIAFEPQPFNHGCLITNVHLNRLAEKVDVRKIALGEQAGRIELVQALEGNYGSFTTDVSLVRQADGDTRPPTFFEVPVSTLDAELIDYQDAVSIIKLDLEGMELDALRGARNVIAKSLPVVAVECFTRSLYQEIKSLLAPFDYFVIDSTNATPTFIFLTRRSPQHLQMLSKYLEMSSVGKFASNIAFNEITP